MLTRAKARVDQDTHAGLAVDPSVSGRRRVVGARTRVGVDVTVVRACPRRPNEIEIRERHGVPKLIGQVVGNPR